MKLTFDMLLEQLDKNDILMNSGQDTKAMQVIKAGMNIMPDFWEKFISLCNNTEGMAELLGIHKEKVPSIAGRVRDTVEQVESKDNAESTKEKLVPTGL